MRKFLIFSLSLGLFLSGGGLTLAKQDNSSKYAPDSEVAQENGTYDVAGHPELKVKVHVYKAAKPQKPGGGGSLVLQCDLPDDDSSAPVGLAGWHLANGNVVYYLNVSSAPSNVSSSLVTIARNSFNPWQAAVNNQVTFSLGDGTLTTRAKYDGQNIIAWGRTSSSALAVTYTWYYTSTGLAVESDTIFNSRYPWAWANPADWITPAGTTCAYKNVYDAQDILTHELGHWMGLDDEYADNYTENTMYGYGSTMETKKDTLTAGDIAGVQALY